MNTLDYLSIIVSLLSLILSVIMMIRTAISNKKEYLQLKTIRKYLTNSINVINSSVDLSNLTLYKRSLDGAKKELHLYCYSIIDVLKRLYPKCNFSVSIKLLKKDAVETIVRTGDELFIDDGEQLINQNTEYNVIVNDKYKYFFVTDLLKYDEKISRYKSSDLEWNYKYNTSIAYPVNNEIDSTIVGFICINSPQNLKKQKSNDMLMKFLKETSNSVSQYISNIQTSD